MFVFLIVACVVLWAVVLFMGFLLLGLLRNFGLLTWRLEQLEATTPSRLGRSGLKPGKKAPDFTLASVHGSQVALHDFLGGRILLVFVQANCAPCHEIVPALNKLTGQDRDLRVLAVIHATPDGAREWVSETGARFPVLIQEDWAVSKRYEVFAAPFVFLINERGVVAAKGIVTERHHLGYLLSSAAPKTSDPVDENRSSTAVDDFSGERDQPGDTASERELTGEGNPALGVDKP